MNAPSTFAIIVIHWEFSHLLALHRALLALATDPAKQWPPLLSNQASYSFNLMFITVLANLWAPRRKHVGKNLLQFWDILVTTGQWETGEFRPPPVLHDTVGLLETGEKVVEPSVDLSQTFPWRGHWIYSTYILPCLMKRGIRTVGKTCWCWLHNPSNLPSSA